MQATTLFLAIFFLIRIGCCMDSAEFNKFQYAQYVQYDFDIFQYDKDKDCLVDGDLDSGTDEVYKNDESAQGMKSYPSKKRSVSVVTFESAVNSDIRIENKHTSKKTIIFAEEPLIKEDIKINDNLYKKNEQSKSKKSKLDSNYYIVNRVKKLKELSEKEFKSYRSEKEEKPLLSKLEEEIIKEKGKPCLHPDINTRAIDMHGIPDWALPVYGWFLAGYKDGTKAKEYFIDKVLKVEDAFKAAQIKKDKN